MAPKFTHSKPLYGRRFRLTQNTIHWGRFFVDDAHYSELSDDAKTVARHRFRRANPQLIADAFEHLLCLQKPDSLNSFYSEMQGLAVYEFSKESLASAPQDENPEQKENLLKSTSESLNAALTAVIESARAIRGKELEFIGLTPTLGAPYSAVFRNEVGFYNAVFDSELVLKSVHIRNVERQVWPPLAFSGHQSGLMANLL